MTHAIVAKKKGSSGAHGLIYFVLERIKRGYWGVGCRMRRCPFQGHEFGNMGLGHGRHIKRKNL
jgi:hypothetical protein